MITRLHPRWRKHLRVTLVLAPLVLIVAVGFMLMGRGNPAPVRVNGLTPAADTIISINDGPLPTTAAGFAHQECDPNHGGGPFPDTDVWVFVLPGDHATTGDFVSVTAQFAGHTDQTITAALNPGNFDNGGPDTSKAWIVTPAGWTLTGGTATITGTASSFNLGAACTASPSASPTPTPSSSVSGPPPPPPSPSPSDSTTPTPTPSDSTTPTPTPSDSTSPTPNPTPSDTPTTTPTPSVSPTGHGGYGSPSPTPSHSGYGYPTPAPSPSGHGYPTPKPAHHQHRHHHHHDRHHHGSPVSRASGDSRGYRPLWVSAL